jgi:hypothetical protein
VCQGEGPGEQPLEVEVFVSRLMMPHSS